MHRRTYLVTSAAVTTGILAGCSRPGGGGEEDGEESGGEEGGGEEGGDEEGGGEEGGGEDRLAEPT